MYFFYFLFSLFNGLYMKMCMLYILSNFLNVNLYLQNIGGNHGSDCYNHHFKKDNLHQVVEKEFSALLDVLCY